MVNNSTNINKTKESLNSDGQQFHQYQQRKRNFKQWWSTIPQISRKQKKVERVMVDNSTNINKTKESLKSDSQQFLQYQQNKRKFKQWWSTIPLISTNLRKLKQWWSTIFQYKQSKRKFKQWWSTIPLISTKQKKA
jgi:hypothetical protein